MLAKEPSPEEKLERLDMEYHRHFSLGMLTLSVAFLIGFAEIYFFIHTAQVNSDMQAPWKVVETGFFVTGIICAVGSLISLCAHYCAFRKLKVRYWNLKNNSKK